VCYLKFPVVFNPAYQLV